MYILLDLTAPQPYQPNSTTYPPSVSLRYSYVATLHDTALPSHHKAIIIFSIVARLGNPNQTVLWVWNAQSARGGVVGRGVLFYSELMPFGIRRDGDGVIFRVAGVWTVQEWSHNMTDTKIQEFSVGSPKYWWFISSRGASSMQGRTLLF